MRRIWAEPFGVTAAGEAVARYTLENGGGMSVSVLTYGCVVQRILVPTRQGGPVDVALGYDSLEGYEAGSCHFGALVGRYANRIKGARFTLNGRYYALEPNDGENHLHGIYGRQVFAAAVEGDALVLRRVSPAGEEGFPGALALELGFHLGEDNALTLDYRARTDADTVLNLTNHSYFNLDGDGDVLDHRITLAADCYTEADGQTLPTGRILPVDGTPLDLRAGRRVGDGLAAGCPLIDRYGGYDHNYVLSGGDGRLRKFAEVTAGRSGIRMEASTTQPGVQLYTGNFVDRDRAPAGKGGVRYPRHAGLCLETQHYPCSPNYPQFPSTVLRPGEEYHHTTVYRFLN